MNVREEFLPYAQPSLTHRELEEVLEAVRSLCGAGGRSASGLKRSSPKRWGPGTLSQ